MKDIDFTTCEFIEQQMSYINFNDFYKRCKLIKQLYSNLDKYQKRFYKWYVYANTYTRLEVKNAIWEYLNNDEIYYYINLLKYKTK